MGFAYSSGSQALGLDQRVAVQQGSRTLTFAELDTYATRFANWLLGLKLAEGTYVAVQLHVCPELAVIEFALQKAKLLKLGICPFATPEEVGRRIGSSTARVFIAHSALCRHTAQSPVFDCVVGFVSVGDPVSGYTGYGSLIGKDTPSSPASPLLSEVVEDSSNKTAWHEERAEKRIALVGPFRRVSSLVVQPYLDAGNALILFDNMAALEASFAVDAVDITHVVLEAETASALMDRDARTASGRCTVGAKNATQGSRDLDKSDVVAGVDSDDDCVAVEAALLVHDAVMEACVIKVHDEGHIERLKAVVALRAGKQVSAVDLITHCLGRTKEQLCLSSVDFVAELPKNARGNTARRLIREQYRQAYRSPR